MMKTTSLRQFSIARFMNRICNGSSFILALMIITSFPQASYAQFPCNVDYKEPTIFCRDLHTTFMPGLCMVEVWAKDLISKASDNYTAEEDLIIAFDPLGEEMSIILVSEGGNEQDVAVYVIDECGNYAVCIVTIFINNNDDDDVICPTTCPIDVNPWCGYSVVTCSAQNCEDPVAAIIDTRFNSQAPKGDNWSDPVDPMVDPVNIIRPNAWNLGNLGMIFGIATAPESGRIYLAASDVYAYDFQQFITVGFPPPTCTGSGGSAGIYMSSFDNPENTGAVIFTSSTYLEAPAVIGGNVIPNSGNIIGDPDECTNLSQCEIPTLAQLLLDTKIGNGIGNIAYDPYSDHIFASNLEDGKIYSINSLTHTVTDVFDPQTEGGFTAYNHMDQGDGLVNQTDRIWGVQVYSCQPNNAKLFFAREASGTPDQVDILKPKEIYSVEINAVGLFVGTETLEFTVNMGDETKITDLAFNSDCTKLLLAERGNSHSAGVYEYMKNGGNWMFNKQIYVGINDPGPSGNPNYPNGIVGNSAGGGVSYGAKEEQNVVDTECDSLIYATANCIDAALLPGRCDVYGLQIVSGEGNALGTSEATDIFIDFNPGLVGNPFAFKSNLGDVDLFNCCCLEEEGRDLIELVRIAGNIQTSKNRHIPDVKVNLSSESSEDFRMTSSTGLFSFEGRTMYQDYLVAPEKDGDIMDGLTTLDLLVLQNHILGIRKLSDPYDIIAGDVDGSESITTKDLLNLRRVLLGKDDQFPSEKVWEFVPSDFIFEDENHPFPFKTDMVIEEISNNSMQTDFVGIKIGDLDGSNSVNQLDAGSRSRMESISFNYYTTISGGKTSLYIRASDVNDMAGVQFTIEGLPNTNFTLRDGAMDVELDNFHFSDGQASFSWVSRKALTTREGELLFVIEMNTPWSDQVKITSSKLSMEAYSSEYEVLNLQTLALPAIVSNGIEGYPNPFTDRHVLTFQLESDTEISLEIYNQNGQLVHSKNNYLKAGFAQISIRRKDLGEDYTGMVFYQLRLGHESYSGKLIVIE